MQDVIQVVVVRNAWTGAKVKVERQELSDTPTWMDGGSEGQRQPPAGFSLPPKVQNTVEVLENLDQVRAWLNSSAFDMSEPDTVSRSPSLVEVEMRTYPGAEAVLQVRRMNGSSAYVVTVQRLRVTLKPSKDQPPANIVTLIAGALHDRGIVDPTAMAPESYAFSSHKAMLEFCVDWLKQCMPAIHQHSNRAED